jgi:hypothetical protein
MTIHRFVLKVNMNMTLLYLCVTDLKKRFQRIPMSTKEVVGATVELQCLPPEGKPLPDVSTRFVASHVV